MVFGLVIALFLGLAVYGFAAGEAAIGAMFSAGSVLFLAVIITVGAISASAPAAEDDPAAATPATTAPEEAEEPAAPLSVEERLGAVEGTLEAMDGRLAEITEILAALEAAG